MIKLDGVSKVYQDVVALHEVSIEINKGEFVFIVGPSGSGKSTLIKLLIREDTPTTGQIFMAGKNIGQLSSWKVRTCGATSGPYSRISSCSATRPCSNRWDSPSR
jgi:cell division transport system ATP-binding protein